MADLAKEIDVAQRTCALCSCNFTPKRQDAIYCSPTCRNRAYSIARKASGRLRKPRVSRCSDCGEHIKRDAMRCVPCLRAARLAARRVTRRRLAAEKRLAAAAVGRPANPRWPWVQGTCAWCEEYFVRRGAASPYCSSPCSSAAKGRRHGFISRAGRLSIYERDDWTCQLCLEPVDPDLHHLDDWAASLDHIRCQSWDKVPDHSPGNLRLAHRWCNSVRGDESQYSAADLVAA